MSDSEEITLSRKTWVKTMEAVEKDGFRKGFELGRDKNYQSGFDEGYTLGFELCHDRAYEVTKKQIIEKSFTAYEPPNIDCVICSMDEDKMMDSPLEDIIQNQRISFVPS